MPRGDGTGRSGAGPMTGRGLGFCAGYDVPGYMQGGFGFAHRRFGGRGFGFGRGFRGSWNRYAPPMYGPYDQDLERTGLQQQAEYLEQELKVVKSRLEALQRESKEAGGDA